MSHSTLNAKISLAMVLDALTPFPVASIMWQSYDQGRVVVQLHDAGTRREVQTRLGLDTPADLAGPYERPIATVTGQWADIPVSVYSPADARDLLAAADTQPAEVTA